MAGWFRFYDETLDEPKVQKLSPEDFKLWINLLCLANRHGGRWPPITDVSYALRIDEIGARSLLDRLNIAGLIDKHKGGPIGYRIGPHNWQKRQYKSDTSTERVKRFRERRATVTETPPEQSRTEQSRAEQKESLLGDKPPDAKANGQSKPKAPVSEHPRFAEFWEAYPRRAGNNPRKPAVTSFGKAVSRGVGVDDLIAGAKAYASSQRSLGKEGTEYVAQAVTWLNQERWNDEAELPLSPEDKQRRESRRILEEHNAKHGR